MDQITFDADLLISIAIAIIMLGIGLSLQLEDFYRVFRHPKAVIMGLVCQLLLLPLIAFALIYFWPIDPVFKVGVIIIASAPGGTASNLVTHLLKGRVALSVSLTSFNSFAIILTIPIYISLALQLFLEEYTTIQLSFTTTFWDILLTVLVPVFIGILINEKTSNKFTDALKKPLKIILPALLVGIVLLAIFSGGKNRSLSYLENFHLLIPLLILNIITILAGYYASKMAGITHKANITIAIEMGLQNSALAIFIASQLLNNEQMEMVAVYYGSFSFFSTLLIGWLLKKQRAGTTP